MRVFEALRQETSQSAVLIFVAFDCDSVCALRIVLDLFRLDHIKYTVRPVIGYGDLRDAFKKTTEKNPEIKVVLLINCGSTVDLIGHFYSDEVDDENLATFYVIDNHRPFDLANVREENQNVLLLCNDEEADYSIYPEDDISDSENDEYENEIEDEDFENEADEIDDFGSDKILSVRKRQRTIQNESNQTEGEENLDNISENNITNEVRKNQNHKEIYKDSVNRKELHHKRRALLEQYYNGTYYGFSSSSCIYDLAFSLHKASNGLL